MARVYCTECGEPRDAEIGDLLMSFGGEVYYSCRKCFGEFEADFNNVLFALFDELFAQLDKLHDRVREMEQDRRDGRPTERTIKRA